MKNIDDILMKEFSRVVRRDGLPPSQRMLAKALKVSTQTINAHIASLVAQGKLKRVRGGVAVLS